MQNAPLRKVTPSPWNRDVEAEAKANGEDWQKHVQSIREHGIIQPIITWPKGDGWEIIAGERRWRGGLAAGLTTVPIIVRTDLTVVDVLELQTIENYQRKNLNPIEEAQKFRQLLDQPGYTMARLCQKIGLEKNTIYGKLKLLVLPPEAQTAVIEKRLPASHAEVISRAKTPAEQKQAFKRITTEGVNGDVVSHARAEEIVKEIRAKAAADEAWEAEVKAANLRGWKVLTAAESRSIISYGHVYGSEWIDLAACCFDDPKRRTWETLLRKSDAQRYIGRCSYSGKIVVLMQKGDATSALAAAGYDWAREKKNDTARQDKIEREFKERRDRQQAYALQIITMVCGKLERECTNISNITMVMRTMLDANFCGDYMDSISVGDEELCQILQRRGVTVDEKEEPIGALKEYVRLAGHEQALSLMAELTIFWTPHIMDENANRRRRHDFARRLRIPVPTLDGICATCGCTETAACDPPCSWTDATKTKCTSCAPADASAGARIGRGCLGNQGRESVTKGGAK